MAAEVFEGCAKKIFDENCIYNEDLGENVLQEPGPETVRVLLDPVINHSIGHFANETTVTAGSLRGVYKEETGLNANH